MAFFTMLKTLDFCPKKLHKDFLKIALENNSVSLKCWEAFSWYKAVYIYPLLKSIACFYKPDPLNSSDEAGGFSCAVGSSFHMFSF